MLSYIPGKIGLTGSCKAMKRLNKETENLTNKINSIPSYNENAYSQRWGIAERPY